MYPWPLVLHCIAALNNSSAVDPSLIPVHRDCQGRLTAATDSQPCAPSCSASPSNNAPNGAGGAASRAAAQPLLLVALLVAALAVLGWGL